MIPKIIRILTYLLLVIYPSGVLLRLRVFSNVQVVPQDFIVFLIFCCCSIYFVKNKTKIFKDNFFKFQIFFLLVGLFSLLVNTFFYKDVNFIVSALYLVRYLIYLNLVNIHVFFEEFKNLKKLMYFSGVLILIIGFVQFIFYNNLQYLFYLGWDNHLYRLFSTFLDPNFAGAFYILLLFFFLQDIMQGKLIRGVSALILAFFTVIAVYVTYSRTALISLLAGLLSYGIVLKKFKLLLLLIIAGIALLLAVSESSIEGLNPLRTASTFERIKSISESGQIIIKNPVIGVGFDAFRYAQIRYGFRNRGGAAISNADAGTNNSFLFVLATTGILGFLVFIFSYFNLIYTLIKSRKMSNVILASSCIALIAGSLFTNTLFYTPILVWFFLMVGLKDELWN